MIVRIEGLRVLLSRRQTFLKFCLIGAFTAALQLALFKVMLSMGANYLFAASVAMTAAVVVSFMGNRRWAFKSGDVIIPQMLRFFYTRATTIAFNYLLLWVMVSRFNIGPLPSQLVSIIVITLINYCFGKLYVFKTRRGYAP